MKRETEESSSKTAGLFQAVYEIKTAILHTRYMAARLANAEMLKLYFGIGGYISVNSRKGKWGTGAIKEISARLQQELPGLKGFSESNIKNMRQFFETWDVILNHQSPSGDLIDGDIQLFSSKHWTNEIFITPIALSNCQTPTSEIPESDLNAFLALSFSHHVELIMHCKTFEERWYYIRRAATEFWSVTALKTHLKSKDFKHRGKMPNNFGLTLPNQEMALKAARMFSEEVFLEGINVGEDEGDVDERLLEHEIVSNIKKFMMSLGPDFCFMGEQFRIIVENEELFIDLLFYNRALKSLIALELKGGKFKPAYLGQLNFYLSALDDKVKMADENPSIGIVLCRDANKSFVEMAIRDMSKPMGVALYRSDKKVPSTYSPLMPMLKGLEELMESN